jgi:hypothetical protein
MVLVLSQGETLWYGKYPLKKGNELENRELVQSLINLFAVVMQRRMLKMELERVKRSTGKFLKMCRMCSTRLIRKA